MGRHNNTIPNGHFHKNWQGRIIVNFRQPLRKMKRQLLRDRKLKRLAPQPVELLRPVVHCPSARYNTKMRAGRGFTLQELKRAGFNRRFALTLGIAVDHRRRNKCLESLVLNTTRLKQYRNNLVLLPSKSISQTVRKGFNVVKAKKIEAAARVVGDEERNFEAYGTLRRARSDAKLLGERLKRKLAAAEGMEDSSKVSKKVSSQ